MIRRTCVIVSMLAVMLAGCVEKSDTIVTFDVVLESTTFENRLVAPVVIYRDGVVIDTLPASTTRIYALGRRGPVRHAWRIVAPLDRYGRKAGIEPVVDLGVQYAIAGHYMVDNELRGSGGGAGRTIFTPMVANFYSYPVRLIANYEVDDQVYTDYLIPTNLDSLLHHAPYFYWNAQSNIRVESTVTSRFWDFSRLDSNQYELKMDPASEYDGSGRTVPVVVN